jgi:protein TonB
MKHWVFFIIAAAIFVSTLSIAQTPADVSPGTLSFENGVIASEAYSNECLGFSLPIPVGWKNDESVVAGGKARHRSDKSLVLLFLRQRENPVGRIILSASAPENQTSTAQDFVSSAVHEQIKVSPDRELVRDASAVGYGGLHFYRADYKGLLGGKEPLYFAYVYTKFRGYVIGETVVASSPQGLDEATNSLHAISFQEDQVNPKCVMAPSEPGPKPTAQRVRIPPEVATGLLVKKITARYPDNARRARVQGQVVMTAQISKDGNVESLTLVSGDPALAPSAMEAVKQWKYKPFLLEGIPTAVETQVTVSFTISEY